MQERTDEPNRKDLPIGEGGKQSEVFRRIASALLFVTVSFICAIVSGDACTLVQQPDSEAQALDLIEKLASPSADDRREAREGLLLLRVAAVPSLILATESESAILRWEAVNLLGLLRDLRATDAVLQVAMTDQDVHARWRANWAITRLDDGTVVLRLIEALHSDDPPVAWNAAVTLSLFGRAEALPVLHQGLEAEGFQQWEAVNALGRVFDAETSSKLVAILKHGSENVRQEAVLSLGRIGGEVARAGLLTTLRGDPSPEVRWRAAMIVGYIGDETTILLLHEILEAETHLMVIDRLIAAIEALTTQRR